MRRPAAAAVAAAAAAAVAAVAEGGVVGCYLMISVSLKPKLPKA